MLPIVKATDPGSVALLPQPIRVEFRVIVSRHSAMDSTLVDEIFGMYRIRTPISRIVRWINDRLFNYYLVKRRLFSEWAASCAEPGAVALGQGLMDHHISRGDAARQETEQRNAADAERAAERRESAARRRRTALSEVPTIGTAKVAVLKQHGITCAEDLAMLVVTEALALKLTESSGSIKPK